jgi:hypothetical protein
VGRNRPTNEKAQRLTFQWGEATIQYEFQIAKLSLAQHDGRKLLGFRVELLAPRRITRNQIFEGSACLFAVSLGSPGVSATMPYRGVDLPL